MPTQPYGTIPQYALPYQGAVRTNTIGSATGQYAQVPDGQKVPDRYYAAAGNPAPWITGQSRYKDADGNPIGIGPRASTGQILDFISENYPGMIGFFNTNSEIRDKLIEAARWGWSPSKLEAEVQSTNWFRNTAVAQRDFEILRANDPASAEAQVQATAANILNSARTLGVGLSGKAVADLAWQANLKGWNDAQTIDSLLSSLNWNTVEPGQLTASVDEIKALAGDYLVSISDSTARQYSARIASGEMNIAGVESVMQAQARGRFSWMAPQIDQGVKPSDYFAPVRDTVARTLEVAPESINLMDPKWLGLVEVRDRDTGQMRAATMNEAMLKSRNQSSWTDTQGAQEMSAGMVQLVKQAFGYS